MRYLLKTMRQFASEKIVVLSGPRQVGKTTLALSWLEEQGGVYLNWDVPEHRERILRGDFVNDPGLDALVLDELHKYPRWKNWLKGLYDRREVNVPVVVTGSARLDVYQRAGESLFGRYEYLRLHPFSIGELSGGRAIAPPADWLDVAAEEDAEELWLRLERRGGFPEPYTRDDGRQHRRWVTQRRTLLVREDLRDITQIRQIALVEHLALLLPERVGSRLSVNALREELDVGHDTVNNWLDALDRLYYCYRITPYWQRLSRALKKERKLYLWDWSEIQDAGARFENMVAGHLLKAVHCWTDLGYGAFELRYLRDKEKREVDFVVTESNRPLVLIECKLKTERPSPALLHYARILGDVPAIQLVRDPGVDRVGRGVRVISAGRFLSTLP